jgi:ABC-type glycerol-3-phosphate transport system permease component
MTTQTLSSTPSLVAGNPGTRKARPAHGFRPGKLVRNLVVIILSVVWLIPTYLLIVNAITPSGNYTGAPLWLPTQGFGLFQNILDGLNGGSFVASAFSSLLYAVVGAGVAVLFATAAAYAIVIMPVKRKMLWFWLIYAGTLLPLQVFAIPLFFAASYTNLYDTHLGLIIVYVAICIPFAFFVIRNFLTTIAPEITEAARLDGASWLRMFLQIHVPLARSAMAAGFVFQFIFIWNELFFGITLSISPGVQPVMAALAGLQGVYATVSEPAILATALAVSIPTVAMFFGFQRFFVSGLSSNL